MPLIKIYGYEKDCEEVNTLRDSLDLEMNNLFENGDAGTTVIHSDCRTCEDTPEYYQYLEILFLDSKEKERIIAVFKRMKIGLDVIFIQLIPDGFIPADQLE